MGFCECGWHYTWTYSEALLGLTCCAWLGVCGVNVNVASEGHHFYILHFQHLEMLSHNIWGVTCWSGHLHLPHSGITMPLCRKEMMHQSFQTKGQFSGLAAVDSFEEVWALFSPPNIRYHLLDPVWGKYPIIGWLHRGNRLRGSLGKHH